jgi:hypothetical protein
VLIVIGTTIRQVTGQPVAAELTWITVGVLGLSVVLHLTVIFENHTLSTALALARHQRHDIARLQRQRGVEVLGLEHTAAAAHDVQEGVLALRDDAAPGRLELDLEHGRMRDARAVEYGEPRHRSSRRADKSCSSMVNDTTATHCAQYFQPDVHGSPGRGRWAEDMIVRFLAGGRRPPRAAWNS